VVLGYGKYHPQDHGWYKKGKDQTHRDISSLAYRSGCPSRLRTVHRKRPDGEKRTTRRDRARQSRPISRSRWYRSRRYRPIHPPLLLIQCRRYRYNHRNENALIHVSILNSVSSWYLGTYSNKSRLAKTTMIKGFPQFGEKGIGIIVIHKMREFQRLHASVRLGEAVSRHF